MRLRAMDRLRREFPAVFGELGEESSAAVGSRDGWYKILRSVGEDLDNLSNKHGEEVRVVSLHTSGTRLQLVAEFDDGVSESFKRMVGRVTGLATVLSERSCLACGAPVREAEGEASTLCHDCEDGHV